MSLTNRANSLAFYELLRCRANESRIRKYNVVTAEDILNEQDHIQTGEQQYALLLFKELTMNYYC
jgi:hypothetical protein